MLSFAIKNGDNFGHNPNGYRIKSDILALIPSTLYNVNTQKQYTDSLAQKFRLYLGILNSAMHIFRSKKHLAEKNHY